MANPFIKTIVEWYTLTKDNPIAQQILEDWVREKEDILWILREIKYPDMVQARLLERDIKEYYLSKEENSHANEAYDSAL